MSKKPGAFLHRVFHEGKKAAGRVKRGNKESIPAALGNYFHNMHKIIENPGIIKVRNCIYLTNEVKVFSQIESYIAITFHVVYDCFIPGK